MVLKTIIMLLLLVVPISLVILLPVTSIPLLFMLYIISAFGTVGIGMGIMHDAIHGSYSNNQTLNKILSYTINLIGASKEVWKLQHNILHHSFTNIHNHDDDINAPFFLRFSPGAKRNFLHKYQHLYAWIFYGLSTLMWVTTKDFVRLRRYYKMGLVKDRKSYIKSNIKILISKIGYYIFTIGLPIIFTPFSPWVLILAFITMHFVTGICITLVFQSAHIAEDAKFPVPNEQGKMETNNFAHQLYTTCNFSPNNKFLFWFVGGLTNQIEHHLFPNICHIHYKKIAPIVKQTALEFGLPYNSHGSFLSAIIKHFKMLRKLGQPELQTVKSNS